MALCAHCARAVPALCENAPSVICFSWVFCFSFRLPWDFHFLDHDPVSLVILASFRLSFASCSFDLLPIAFSFSFCLAFTVLAFALARIGVLVNFGLEWLIQPSISSLIPIVSSVGIPIVFIFSLPI